MSWPYAYTPYIWPMLASAAFLGLLAVYGWRHRTTPGAVPFVGLMLAMAIWGLGSAAEAASSDLSTQYFWFLFQDSLSGLAVIFALCFALEYAGLGKWVTPRNVALLLVPAVINLFLILTNESHSLKWSRIWYEGNVRADLGPAGLALTIYGMALLLLPTVIFIVLFIRSPLHRWPVGLILLGQLAPRVAYPLMVTNLAAASPLNLTVLSFNFTALMYALALFRFHLFDVVPVGRDAAIEHMADGLLVLDAESRIVDLNPAAEEVLALAHRATIGRPAGQALAAYPDFARLLEQEPAASAEMTLNGATQPRSFQVHISPLVHPGGFKLGRLILLQDVTEQKHTRELLLQHQRTVAMIQERERLARELHDGLGQILAAAHLQASTAKRLLAQGANAQTDECLDRLAEMTLEAEADVREYLLGARTVFSTERPFFLSLRQYLARLSQRYGLQVELTIPPQLEARGLGPGIEVQLLRIIQEALSNVRKHARAHCAHVSFTMAGAQVRIAVIDDGQGFDPVAVAAQSEGFGLRAMRERSEGLGGTLAVISSPGQGTQVVVHVPFEE